MTVWSIILMSLFGFGAGALTAAGLFALVTALRIINRMAHVTNTNNRIRLYENMIIFGVIVGSVFSMFDLNINFGISGLIIYGLASGAYIGIFAVCLGETIKALPVFVRRIRIGTGVAFVILCIALGKAAGQLLYYLKLYIE